MGLTLSLFLSLLWWHLMAKLLLPSRHSRSLLGDAILPQVFLPFAENRDDSTLRGNKNGNNSHHQRRGSNTTAATLTPPRTLLLLQFLQLLPPPLPPPPLPPPPPPWIHCRFSIPGRQRFGRLMASHQEKSHSYLIIVCGGLFL